MNTRIAFFVPHSFLLAILLTFAVYLLGIFGAYQGPFDMIQFWVNGFWNLLSFSMQMVLMVLTGFSVASVPGARKVLRWVAKIPRAPRQGVMLLCGLTAALSWLHWGIGLVAGAFLAREMGRRVAWSDYPLLVACAYIGMCAGSFGATAFEPLVVSREGHLLQKTIGVIPLVQTSLSWMALVGFSMGTLVVTVLAGMICPPREKAVPLPPDLRKRFEEEDQAEEDSIVAESEWRRTGKKTLGVWLEHSRWPVWLVSVMGFTYIIYWFYGREFSLDLNMLNFILFFLALSLHDTPMRFLQSMERSVRAASGIIVQFPFYAGIQGMLASSGLAVIFLGWITAFASPTTLPFWIYLNGAFVNLFVPTSGGIWEIQGPLVIKVAQSLGASLPRTLNAFTAGEIIGNLVQPFWAIPLLGICGLAMRDIMGYCLMAFSVLSLIWLLAVTLLPL